jgi:dihydropteroate synthase
MVSPILRSWKFGDNQWVMGDFPRLMGIVNVTPDSFSDGGIHQSVDSAIEHALKLAEQGADILDIGGESTRPGAEPVSEKQELERVIPVIEKLSSLTEVPISIDTMKSVVAKEAIQAGAIIVNDVSGLEFDPEMPSVCAETNAGVICMHMKGDPQTMQDEPVYENVCKEITEYLAGRIEFLKQNGISQERIVIDPGVGFGKTAEHNLEIMKNISTFRDTDSPVLIGHSRKRFLSKMIGRKVDERLAGTIGVSIALAMQNVDIIRVHDIQAVKDSLIAWKSLSDGVPLSFG